MIAAYLFAEDRKADVIAYGVSLAWGGKKARRKKQQHGKPSPTALKKFLRGEGDGTPIDLTPSNVTAIFPEAAGHRSEVYVPPPSTMPGEDERADISYLMNVDAAIKEAKSKKGVK